jgi:hypothetical protein
MLGLLKRKVAVDLSAVDHPDDRRILGLLAAQGDPLHAPRHTRFYFYARKGERMDAVERFVAIAQEAARLGFHVAEQRRDALILEIDQSMEACVVNAARALMEDWGRRFAVEFDGWECRIARAA